MTVLLDWIVCPDRHDLALISELCNVHLAWVTVFGDDLDDDVSVGDDALEVPVEVADGEGADAVLSKLLCGFHNGGVGTDPLGVGGHDVSRNGH